MLAFLRIEKESLKLGFGKNWRESGGNGGRGEMGSPLFIEVAANYADQSMGLIILSAPAVELSCELKS